MDNIKEVKKYNTFEEYCDNVYCCNKNVWSNIDEDCEKCKEDYHNARQLLAQNALAGEVATGDIDENTPKPV